MGGHAPRPPSQLQPSVSNFFVVGPCIIIENRYSLYFSQKKKSVSFTVSKTEKMFV